MYEEDEEAQHQAEVEAQGEAMAAEAENEHAEYLKSLHTNTKKKAKNFKITNIVYDVYVAGNLRDYDQSYTIQHLTKYHDLCNKVILYINWKHPEKEFALRSMYFSSTEQLKDLIVSLVKAWFMMMENRIKTQLPKSQFRLFKLNELFKSIKQSLSQDWMR